MIAKAKPDLKAIPMLLNESMYIGVDIGKFKHVAGFVSTTLLQRHQRFESCPAFTFEQSRAGFQAFLDRVRAFVPLEHCFLLICQGRWNHEPIWNWPPW